jgi:YVTN family beta-propeller protein
VIDTASNRVITKIPVGVAPAGVAVNPDGSKVYVTNSNSVSFSKPGTVSVIAAGINTVIATIQVGITPGGVAVSPDGSKVYVANQFSKNVSVINAATNTVIATIPVGEAPVAVGVFNQSVQPAPRG